MITYVTYDPTSGALTGSGYCDPATWEAHQGVCTCLAYTGTVPDPNLYWVNPAVTPAAITARNAPLITTFQQNVSAKAAAALNVYLRIIAAGYLHTDGHVYQLGPDNLGSTGAFNLAAIALLCQRAIAGDTAAWPSGAYIRDASNNNVIYSATDALGVATAAGTYVDTCRRNYWSIKAAIMEAADQTALDAIGITAGYP